MSAPVSHHDPSDGQFPSSPGGPSADHDGHGGVSERQDTQNGPDHHGSHGWLMIACCIPMLFIAVALVATGVVSSGFLLLALSCTALMALMMRGMHGR